MEKHNYHMREYWSRIGVELQFVQREDGDAVVPWFDSKGWPHGITEEQKAAHFDRVGLTALYGKI